MKNIWDILLNIIIVLCIISLILIVIYQFNNSYCDDCNRYNNIKSIENFTTTQIPKPIPTPISIPFNNMVLNENMNLSDTVSDILNLECTQNNEQNSETNCINGIFEENYIHNIKPFLKNQIDIDDLNDKISKINSNLEKELYKKTIISADGNMIFY
jgi:hypothetical protein